METREYTELTGCLKTFNLDEEIKTLVKLPSSKPSTLIIRTKKGKKAIAALRNIEKNHNYSWYKELKKRSAKDPNALALFYRGTEITMKEMFEKADELAEALAQSGVIKGDEIPACLSNTPELVYLLLAANKIGAKLNLFGNHFEKEYLFEILNSCSNKVIFVSDDNYEAIKDVIQKVPFENKVLVSLSDSLPKNPEKTKGYEPSLKDYYHYPNRVVEFQKEDQTIQTFSDFSEVGKGKNLVIDNNNLDTEFLVTYTSGSTKIGHPKQIIHSNRSLIVAGIFHDPNLSGNPELKGLRGLAHIHAESNTDVITCISDNLMQLWSVALEPEYDKNKALDYVMLNKPNYLNITTSFLVQMSKQYLIERKYHENGVGRKLDFLLAAFAVGEKTSKGEEKFINTFLRKSRAGSGIKIKGLSMPFTTLSVGGGDCEHGGIYYSLWRSMYEKLNYFKLANKEYGLMPVPYAQVSAFKLNANGQYVECNFNEMGLIAANSATTMIRYKNQPKETRDLIITDNVGRDWISSNVYGYIDELGGVHVKGRIENAILFKDGTSIPTYMIEEVVERDTKNILSCTVTQAELNGEIIPIVNIELQPLKKKPSFQVVEAIKVRIREAFGEEMESKVVFRMFNNHTSFPLTGSGKRSVPAIEKMGLEKVFITDSGKLKFIEEEQLKEKLKKFVLTEVN